MPFARSKGIGYLTLYIDAPRHGWRRVSGGVRGRRGVCVWPLSQISFILDISMGGGGDRSRASSGVCVYVCVGVCVCVCVCVGGRGGGGRISLRCNANIVLFHKKIKVSVILCRTLLYILYIRCIYCIYSVRHRITDTLIFGRKSAILVRY